MKVIRFGYVEESWVGGRGERVDDAELDGVDKVDDGEAGWDIFLRVFLKDE
jgi:hypothetical protein